MASATRSRRNSADAQSSSNATTRNLLEYIALGPLMLKLSSNVKGIDWDTTQEYEELKKCNYPVQVERLEGRTLARGRHLRLRPGHAHGAGNPTVKWPTSRGRRCRRRPASTTTTCMPAATRTRSPSATSRPAAARSSPRPRSRASSPETVSPHRGLHQHPRAHPFRTLTGRAHFYEDHEWFLDFGEASAPTSRRSTSRPREGARQRAQQAAPDPVVDHATSEVGHPLQLPGQACAC